MTVLTDKPEVDRIDVALLVEELVEIYITSTPKSWHEAEKIKTILIDWEMFLQPAVTLYYL